jgi:FHS family L-fucose permease-like MFS transporter
MSIIGGAIVPAVMGKISDVANIQRAFVVPLLCHAYVLYFALRGYKLATTSAADTLLNVASSEAE